jgi:hypothetical protein
MANGPNARSLARLRLAGSLISLNLGSSDMVKARAPEQYSEQETRQRFEAALRGARIAWSPACRKCDSEARKTATEKRQKLKR